MQLPFHYRRRGAGAALALLLLLPLCGCGGGGKSDNSSDSSARQFPLSTLARTEVTVNGSRLRVWIMDTEEKRSEGMMHLDTSEVADDEGMLFVYPDAEYRHYWMRNTAIPLDIAFANSARAIVNTAAMQPFDETRVSSNGPAQFVLEVKQGTLSRLGIVTGQTVTIPESVQTARVLRP